MFEGRHVLAVVAGLAAFLGVLVLLQLDRRRASRGAWPGTDLMEDLAAGRQEDALLRLLLGFEAALERDDVERAMMAAAQAVSLLLVMQRFTDARALVDRLPAARAPHLRMMARTARIDIAVIEDPGISEHLHTIEAAREETRAFVPERYREVIDDATRPVEGLVRLALGERDAGIEAIERGLPAMYFNPLRVLYEYRLAEALEARGDKEAAARGYQRVLRLFPDSTFGANARERLETIDPVIPNGARDSTEP